jgi:hypothetical protein
MPGNSPATQAAAAVLAAASALGLALLAGALPAAAPLPGRIPETVLARFGGTPGARATLLVAGSGACEACRRARAEAAASRDLRKLEIRVAPAELAALEAAGVRFPPGAIPVYALVASGGRVLAARRGYLPEPLLLRWVRRAQAPP